MFSTKVLNNLNYVCTENGKLLIWIVVLELVKIRLINYCSLCAKLRLNVIWLNNWWYLIYILSSGIIYVLIFFNNEHNFML